MMTSQSTGKDTMPPLPLPYRFAYEHGVLCTNGRIYYRATTPLFALQEVQRTVNPIIKVEQLDDDAFGRRLQELYEGDSEVLEDLTHHIGEQVDLAELAKALPKVADLAEQGNDAPIVDLLNKVLAQAIRSKASDIHIEPATEGLRIRFRHDGMLTTVSVLQLALASFLVSRVKIMAKLDIAESRLPQDGRFTRKLAGKPVDVRVSVIPSGPSERVVMRLLERESERLRLNKLGMPDTLYDSIKKLLQRPNGIILVTGPTNSGKTTTLYAALQSINHDSRNIMTIEDPVEYNLKGISQTAVNQKAGMTFDKGLRAMLRQDPDVVMVGEIRDLETARTAIRASQTGHLVFSTLHTNSAIGAITRLHDMGVPSYLLASSVIAVLAQRLVRSLCPECKVEITAADDDRKDVTAKGCQACNFTGFQGRLGIYELFEVTSAINQAIHDHEGEGSLELLARQRHKSLYENGMGLVSKGLTTVAEVARVSHKAL